MRPCTECGTNPTSHPSGECANCRGQQDNSWTPVDKWIILYWDALDRRWVLAESAPDEGAARERRDRYVRELGVARVRMLHTADGI